MLDDLRLALRGLRRAPAFAAAAVLCLALGVGANTAVFTAARAVLLRPVATPDIDRLVAVREELPRLKLHDTQIAPPEVFDLVARRDVFAAVAGIEGGSLTLVDEAGATRYKSVRTYGDFFGTFRVRPQLGRFYTSDDSRDGRHRVAVLSDGFWRERFGGDPAVIGRPLRFSRASYTVVGVLPPDFRYPRSAQLFTPAVVDSATAGMRGTLTVNAIGRLRDGVTLEQAQGALTAEALAFLAGGRLVASQLYGVGPRDPVTILGGAALLGAVALLASYLPARRATRVDPAVALRAE